MPVTSRLALLVCLGLGTLAACGDDQPDTDTPDANGGVDASVTATYQAVVAATDFTDDGVLSKVDLTTLTPTANVAQGIVGKDPVVRRFGDKIYVVNRDTGNNVTIIDAHTLALVEQIATGANTNPQDVAVHGTKLYVPALGTSGVVVLTEGSATTTTIDLSDLDGNDDLPDCMSAFTVGDKVFVACGVLDGFTAVGKGKLAVIDTSDDTVETSFDLIDNNPFALLQATPADSMFGGDLLIGSIPTFGDNTAGCLARIKTTSPFGTNGCAVTAADLGGYPARYEASADGHSLYIATGAYDGSFNFSGTLRKLILSTGQLSPAALSDAFYVVNDFAPCADGTVVVSDVASGASGIRVYRLDAEVTTDPLDVGEPPKSAHGLVCTEQP